MGGPRARFSTLLCRACSRSLSPSLLPRIIELNGGQSPLTYKRFQTLISRMEPVEGPADCITAEIMGKCSTPLSDDHDDKYGVPSLEELGECKQNQGLNDLCRPLLAGIRQCGLFLSLIFGSIKKKRPVP